MSALVSPGANVTVPLLLMWSRRTGDVVFVGGAVEQRSVVNRDGIDRGSDRVTVKPQVVEEVFVCCGAGNGNLRQRGRVGVEDRCLSDGSPLHRLPARRGP